MTPDEKIQGALTAFGIVSVKRIKLLSNGLMHKTYRIDTSAGSYILQQLHHLLSTEGVMNDFVHVTDHLRTKGFFAPVCIRTASGEVMYRNSEHAYRMQTFIPGKAFFFTHDAEHIREAGRIVGLFHRAMADFPHTYESDLILHRSRAIHANMEKVFNEHASSPLMTQEVHEIGTFLIKTMPAYFLPDSLPMRNVHSDLKISNVMFDEEDRAVSLIDFDTCNRMALPLEMGDAFRTWCGDDEDRQDNFFSMGRFKAGWEGYSEAVGDFLTAEEREHIVRGVFLITLEIASRFFTDYFNDSYFGWNSDRYTSRRAHNLARAKGQIALYHSLNYRRAEAEMIVKNN